MATIGFIGLGNMGGPMAKNLLKAGHQVSVFDLVPAACDALAKEGALKASTARDAITDADYIISMLPAGKHVAETYIGQNGLLAMIGNESCVLDCSTIDAETARKVGQAAQKSGVGFMDAPVSGGVAAAAAGTLSFMCGGDAETFEKARQMAKANQDNMGESRALVNLAGTLWHLGQRHAAFLLMEQGESLAKSAGDQIGVCRILLNRGFFYQAHNNPTQAQECIEQALMLAETLDWSEGIAHAQDALRQISL